MATQDFFETEGFTAEMDVSASTRKFQTSVIIKQDPNKSGILTFLSQLEQETDQQSAMRSEPTLKPQRRQDGYNG